MLDSGSTMEKIQLIIGIVLLVSIHIIIIRIIYKSIRTYILTGDDLKFDKIRSIYKPLKKGNDPAENLVKKHANNLAYRTLVYEALQKYNRTQLFPKDLFSIEKSSESYLANWLNMHDDFDSFPNEIKYVQTTTLHNENTVLIFKFKVYEPHLYADKNWMFGYVGYKKENTTAYAKPTFIQSNFEDNGISEKQLEKITSNTP